MNPRADLYQSLAEAMLEPPGWMALPGHRWPLFQSVSRLAHRSPAAAQAAGALECIEPDSQSGRQARYRRLFYGAGRPRIWLYESVWLTGQMGGPITIELERLYQLSGLEIPNAELADHASLELAFLAYIAACAEPEREGAALWRALERRFIKRHAGRWLPQLGRQLARSGDPVYGPIGSLMASWLLERRSPLSSGHVKPANYPVMKRPQSCILCSFCAQVCPSGAIEIRETQLDTQLLFFPASCIHCEKCAQVCGPRSLEMSPARIEVSQVEDWDLLVSSPRAACPSCLAPTVSEAELAYVAAQLEQPPWLPYCLDCRPLSLEVQV